MKLLTFGHKNGENLNLQVFPTNGKVFVAEHKAAIPPPDALLFF
jgi:hypothetical protein